MWIPLWIGFGQKRMMRFFYFVGDAVDAAGAPVVFFAFFFFAFFVVVPDLAGDDVGVDADAAGAGVAGAGGVVP
jgi:hypothetical protein